MPRFVRYLVPLALFLAMAALLYRGLGIDPRLVPSPLVGKSAPQFSLTRLEDPSATLSNSDFTGQVSLLNVWATWCVSCRAEHQVLMQLAAGGQVPIYGLNYKDDRPAALRWLEQFGDPYRANAYDADGRVGIDWGVYGTPETFVIDKRGVIRHKYTGPLTQEIVQRELLPLVKQLRAEKG
jgi:cytochrome c biogenesis protein CcmG, thiol:disulfide interchange protein DsbE